MSENSDWKIKYFDDAQILILGPNAQGRLSLIANCTGDNRLEDARSIVEKHNSATQVAEHIQAVEQERDFLKMKLNQR